jgi:hypothetical protein
MRNVISLLSFFVLPLIVVGFPLYGLIKKVPVYESFVEGAKEGFQVAVRIIPYLVAILFAIGMFRASGAMDFLIRGLTRCSRSSASRPRCCPWRSSGRSPGRAPPASWWT